MRQLGGVAILGLMALLVVMGALLPPQDMHAIDLLNRHGASDSRHWLGTDHLGRDLFSRLAAGGWRAMLATALAATLAVGGGLMLGLAAAVAPGGLRGALLRIADLLALLPELVIAILVVAVLGFSPWSVALGIGLGAAGSYALLVHGLAVSTLGQPFVLSARALGVSPAGIARRHVLPAVLPSLRTYAASHVGQIVMQYAALAFLGFGADSGAPDWGAMLYEYRFHLLEDPALVLWPGLAILFFVLGLYLTLEPQGLPRRVPPRQRMRAPLATRLPAE